MRGSLVQLVAFSHNTLWSYMHGDQVISDVHYVIASFGLSRAKTEEHLKLCIFV